jgi:hypothetical protein
VSFRSSSPERNANIVNELVKQFVGESRREAQDKARTDVKYYYDKLAIAKNYHNEIASRMREFERVNSWLDEDLPALYRACEAAEERLADTKRQIAVLKAGPRDAQAEQKLCLLEAALPDEQRKVGVLQERVRVAPERMMARDALRLELAALQRAVSDYAKDARLADRELQRLFTEAYSSRYRVIEYARDDRSPIKGAAPVVMPAIQGKAPPEPEPLLPFQSEKFAPRPRTR